MRDDVRYAGWKTGALPHARDPAAVLLEEILNSLIAKMSL